MKGAVKIKVIGEIVVTRHQRVQALKRPLKFGMPEMITVRDGIRYGLGLEIDPQVVYLADLAQRNGRDARSAVRVVYEKPLGGQPLKRLAEGRVTNPQALAPDRTHQAFAGLHLAKQNRSTNLLGNEVGSTGGRGWLDDHDRQFL